MAAGATPVSAASEQQDDNNDQDRFHGNKHGGGRLALGPDHPDFAQYLYWFHFANGNLQPNMGRNMMLRRLHLAADNPVMQAMQGRLDRVLDLIEKRLGEADYFAGSEFPAADIIMVPR